MGDDIRLKSLPFAYGGKTYVLRCNMAVLADVQEANDGKISTALSGARGMKNSLQFLAAMMNDYADLQGWPERFTWRELGRALRTEEVPMGEIIALVLDALTPQKTENPGEPDGDRGN